MKRILFTLVALFVFVARLFVPPGSHAILVECYKDFAHFYMGALAMAWHIKRYPFLAHLFWALGIWEILNAAGSRIIPHLF
jgi:hypothetical protein